jgi:hypothetical protein
MIPNISSSMQQWVACQDIFLNYVSKNVPLPVTPSGNPKGNVLMELNELMQFYQTPNKTNKSKYDVFFAVYLLFESSFGNGILEKKENAKGKIEIVVNHSQLEKYWQCNEVEKYFTYFTSFYCLLDIDTTIFNMPYYHVHELIDYLTSQKANRLLLFNVSTSSHDRMRIPIYEPHYAMWFHCFGLIEIIADYTIPAKKIFRFVDYFTSLEITKVGEAMFKILTKERPLAGWNRWANQESDLEMDFLGKYNEKTIDFIIPFKALFPELKNIVLPLPKEKIDLGKNVVFHIKVGLSKDIYREIAISGKDTFEELHNAIQDAYDFGNDHLYFFAMDSKHYQSRIKFVCPYEDDLNRSDEYAHKVKLQDYAWAGKQKFQYVFDYGDDWVFSCQLLEIKNAASPQKKYKITKVVGEAPEQYPNYD